PAYHVPAVRPRSVTTVPVNVTRSPAVTVPGAEMIIGCGGGAVTANGFDTALTSLKPSLTLTRTRPRRLPARSLSRALRRLGPANTGVQVRPSGEYSTVTSSAPPSGSLAVHVTRRDEALLTRTVGASERANVLTTAPARSTWMLAAAAGALPLNVSV